MASHACMTLRFPFKYGPVDRDYVDVDGDAGDDLDKDDDDDEDQDEEEAEHLQKIGKIARGGGGSHLTE